MGLFKNTNCAECGSRTNFLTRMDLKDGKYLCGKCAKAIPECIKMYANTEYGFEDCIYAKQWAEASIAKYASVYKETYRYGELGIDEENGLFTLDYYKAGKTPILRIEDIIDYDFRYFPELKEGLLVDKAKGNVLLVMTIGDPEFMYQKVLEYDAKGKAHKISFGNKYEYENPPRMEETKRILERLQSAFPPKYTVKDFRHKRYHYFAGVE